MSEVIAPSTSQNLELDRLFFLGDALFAIGRSTLQQQAWLWMIEDNEVCSLSGGSNLAVCNDLDGDRVADEIDNCPSIANSTQLNVDRDSFGDVCDLDADGDTIPNAYEVANGLNPLDPSDALKDADGDGFTNLVEFELGSNPQTADTDRNRNGIPDSLDAMRLSPILNYVLDE